MKEWAWMVYVQWESFFFGREQGFRGRERTTYWCMLAILYSLFSILPNFSFLSFLFFFFLCVYLFAVILLKVAITVFVIVIVPPYVHGMVSLYSVYRDRIYYFSL